MGVISEKWNGRIRPYEKECFEEMKEAHIYPDPILIDLETLYYEFMKPEGPLAIQVFSICVGTSLLAFPRADVNPAIYSLGLSSWFLGFHFGISLGRSFRTSWSRLLFS